MNHSSGSWRPVRLGSWVGYYIGWADVYIVLTWHCMRIRNAFKELLYEESLEREPSHRLISWVNRTRFYIQYIVYILTFKKLELELQNSRAQSISNAPIWFLFPLYDPTSRQSVPSWPSNTSVQLHPVKYIEKKRLNVTLCYTPAPTPISLLRLHHPSSSVKTDRHTYVWHIEKMLIYDRNRVGLLTELGSVWVLDKLAKYWINWVALNWGLVLCCSGAFLDSIYQMVQRERLTDWQTDWRTPASYRRIVVSSLAYQAEKSIEFVWLNSKNRATDWDNSWRSHSLLLSSSLPLLPALSML